VRSLESVILESVIPACPESFRISNIKRRIPDRRE
jgi:hypothetical protein